MRKSYRELDRIYKTILDNLHEQVYIRDLDVHLENERIERVNGMLEHGQ